MASLPVLISAMPMLGRRWLALLCMLLRLRLNYVMLPIPCLMIRAIVLIPPLLLVYWPMHVLVVPPFAGPTSRAKLHSVPVGRSGEANVYVIGPSQLLGTAIPFAAVPIAVLAYRRIRLWATPAVLMPCYPRLAAKQIPMLPTSVFVFVPMASLVRAQLLRQPDRPKFPQGTMLIVHGPAPLLPEKPFSTPWQFNGWPTLPSSGLVWAVNVVVCA